MNSILLEDEEREGLHVEEETVGENGLQLQGFDPKLCVVGRFISEGKVTFLKCNIQWLHYENLEKVFI